MVQAALIFGISKCSNGEPDLDPRRREEKALIEGNPPSPIDIPSGCRFNPRCPFASERCKNEEPQLEDVGNGHLVACFNYSDKSI